MSRSASPTYRQFSGFTPICSLAINNVAGDGLGFGASSPHTMQAARLLKFKPILSNKPMVNRLGLLVTIPHFKPLVSMTCKTSAIPGSNTGLRVKTDS